MSSSDESSDDDKRVRTSSVDFLNLNGGFDVPAPRVRTNSKDNKTKSRTNSTEISKSRTTSSDNSYQNEEPSRTKSTERKGRSASKDFINALGGFSESETETDSSPVKPQANEVRKVRSISKDFVNSLGGFSGSETDN
jgi:hypothetical protein